MDVQFNEPEYTNTPTARSAKQGPLMRFIIARGWAKDETAAERVLLYVAVIVVVITGMVWVSQMNFGGNTPPPAPADVGAGIP